MSYNPYYVAPGGDYSKGLSGLATAMGSIGKRKREEEVKVKAQARFETAQADITEAYQSGDPDKVALVSFKYPEFQSVIQASLGVLEKSAMRSQTNFMSDVLTNPDEADSKFQRRIKMLEDGKRDSTQTKQSYSDFLASPEAELREMRMTLAAVSPDAYKVFQEGESKGKGKGAGISPASPKDFTVESLAEYQVSRDIGVLKRYRPQIKEIAGVQHQYNPESLMWEPLVDMESSELAGQAAASTALEAEKQSKLDFTKAQSKFRDNESKLISSIGSGRSKDVILQSTATEIRDLASALSTEYGAVLSSFPATEARQMKGLINTIRANSAFTTLVDLKASGGTLGAISEAELTLLESAMGSLDQAGTVEELIRVLDQVMQANQSAMQRVENAYQMDKGKYGTSFEEATKEELTDEEVLGKYL